MLTGASYALILVRVVVRSRHSIQRLLSQKTEKCQNYHQNIGFEAPSFA
ncbi:hypothetical protein AVDCRST_MAG84-2697 [uncultured Microcoleus sp.]|uniref:Uncharacterized protein n=1 Tax=uncultured Microcoleus sp. TaxID=259945 RepID=A0A6J4M2S0_9CYAN|nr:hypothetical protein AVDCRST_MAG84-2697 [uncultured Microcoleus sp.]